jgi:putative ABC transport system permease protein
LIQLLEMGKNWKSNSTDRYQKNSPVIRHYLRTLGRRITRDKRSFILNIGGLAVGMAGALLLLLYVYHELSYDRHFADADRIYRLACSTRIGNTLTEFAALPPAIGPAVARAIPGVEAMARMQYSGTMVIKKEQELFTQDGIYIADSSLLRVFSYRFRWGNRDALREPNAIVLTRQLADKLFDEKAWGAKGPLGQRVTLAGNDFLVGGVVEDPPANSHFQFQALVAWHSFDFPEVWDDAHAYTYVKLAERTDAGTFSENLAQFVANQAELKELAEKLDAHIEVIVQPLTRIHLHSNYLGELSPNGNLTYVYLFALVAGFLLLCAGINYTNLAIAASLNRGKEIGVRKVMGADRGQIRTQFLAESVVLTLLAALLGLLIAWLSLPWFNRLVDQPIRLNLQEQPILLLWFAGLVGLTGLLSGAYPAFYLSRLDPTRALKSGQPAGSGHLSIRKVLVLAQFAMAIGLVSATLLVRTQMNFIRNKALGFEKEHVLVVPVPRHLSQNLAFFEAELAKIPGVAGTAACNYVPGNAPKDEHRIERTNGELKVSTVHRLHFDHRYLSLLGMPLVKGRGFDPSFPTDYTEAFLVNEAAVRAFGWNEPGQNPIGKKIDGFNYGKQGVVIGVVKDVHLFSLRQRIEPVVMNLSPTDYSWGESVYIKLKENQTGESLKAINHTFGRVFESYPFSYSFLDEQYNRLYQADQRMETTLRCGAVLMGLLSSLGIFGLSLFLVARRSRETAIRKMLGASVGELIGLHVRVFIRSALWANLVAWPLTFLLIRFWLRDFAYQTNITPVPFLLAGLSTLLLVLLTVSYQAYWTARAKPVAFLKQE